MHTGRRMLGRYKCMHPGEHPHLQRPRWEASEDFLPPCSHTCLLGQHRLEGCYCHGRVHTWRMVQSRGVPVGVARPHAYRPTLYLSSPVSVACPDGPRTRSDHDMVSLQLLPAAGFCSAGEEPCPDVDQLLPNLSMIAWHANHGL